VGVGAGSFFTSGARLKMLISIALLWLLGKKKVLRQQQL